MSPRITIVLLWLGVLLGLASANPDYQRHWYQERHYQQVQVQSSGIGLPEMDLRGPAPWPAPGAAPGPAPGAALGPALCPVPAPAPAPVPARCPVPAPAPAPAADVFPPPGGAGGVKPSVPNLLFADLPDRVAH